MIIVVGHRQRGSASSVSGPTVRPPDRAVTARTTVGAKQGIIPADGIFLTGACVVADMSDELPAELTPEDLPDDPDALKRLVCDLYATVMASDQLIKAVEGGPAEDGADLGWLTEHLEPGSPIEGEPGE